MAVKQPGIPTKAPALLSYPRVFQFKELPELKGVFCYVIKAYPLHGLSAVIRRYKEDDTHVVTWRLGDWDGHTIDIAKEHLTKSLAKIFMLKYSDKVLGVMQKIGLPQAQLYMAENGDDLILTDVRTYANKLLGPGATIQLFSGVMPVQTQVIRPLILDEPTIEKISKNARPFNEPVIFKPSAFKTIVRGKELQPMYGIHNGQ